MKQRIFAAALAVALLGSNIAAFAQDAAPKTDKKARKSVKKEMKGKPHKAVKKAVKSDKKDDMAK